MLCCDVWRLRSFFHFWLLGWVYDGVHVGWDQEHPLQHPLEDGRLVDASIVVMVYVTSRAVEDPTGLGYEDYCVWEGLGVLK